jgi:hypothetical protein
MLIMGQNEKMTNRDIVLENHKPVETCGWDSLTVWFSTVPDSLPQHWRWIQHISAPVNPLTRLSLPTNPNVSTMNFYAYRTLYTQLHFDKSTLLTTCRFLPAAC